MGQDGYGQNTRCDMKKAKEVMKKQFNKKKQNS